MAKKRFYVYVLSAIFLMACNLTDLASQVQVPTAVTAGIPGATDLAPESKAAAPTLPATPSPAPGQTVIEPENADRLHQTISGPLDNPFGLRWSNDSKIIGAMLPEGMALLDASRLATVSNVQVLSPVTLLDISAEGRLMATTLDQKSLELRDIGTGNVTRTLQYDQAFFGAVFSPDGKTLAVPLTDQVSVDLWDVAGGQKTQTLTGFQAADGVYGIYFSQDGRYLIWVSRANVQVMEISSGTMGPNLSHEDFVGGLALAPDGRTLAVATSGTLNNQTEPFIQIWDAFDGSDLGKIPSGEFITASLDFSPDGRLLVGGSNNTAVVWDTATLKELKVLGGHTDRINSLKFSPDGKTLATAGADGQLKLWQVSP